MLGLSKKAYYTLEAVLDIAYNARPDPVQARDITRRQGIPQRYLEQVMQHLVRVGVLRGVRGPKGGYRLARERRRITVAEVLRHVADLERGEELGQDTGSDFGHQVIRPMLQRIEEELMTRLETVTIEDLYRNARAAGIATADRPGDSFEI